MYFICLANSEQVDPYNGCPVGQKCLNTTIDYKLKTWKQYENEIIIDDDFIINSTMNLSELDCGKLCRL